MTKAFHIDRGQTLKPGILSLTSVSNLDGDERFRSYSAAMFPDGLSRAGLIYTLDIPFAYVDAEGMHIIDGYQRVREIELEYVRRLRFPDHPSRFQSFFAAKTKADTRLWLKELNANAAHPGYCVWEIQYDECRPYAYLDAAWRDIQLSDSDHNRIIYSAYEQHLWSLSYWSGEITSSPRMELVISLAQNQVEVLRKVVL